MGRVPYKMEHMECRILNAKEARDKDIVLVHTKGHINLIKQIGSEKFSRRKRTLEEFNSIYFNEGSSEAAYLAAGSVIEVAEKVAEGELDSAFAIVMPPGHHAEEDEPMGFCLFNNVGIATSYLLNERVDLGIKKILIVDWDVHHGNGTQKMFWKDPRVLFFSVHRHESGSFYPGGEDGSHVMIGEGHGAGYNINVPWENAGCDDADYLAVWDNILVPIAKEFCPDLIMISAGFDAAIVDPLGECCVSPYGYSMILHKLMELVGGRIVMALEGGYDLDSTAKSVLACIEVLLQKKPILGTSEANPSESTWRVIQSVRDELSAFWPTLAEKLPKKVTMKRNPYIQEAMLVQTRSQFRKKNCEMDYKTFLQYNRRTVRSTISHRRKQVAGEKNVKMNAAAAVERKEDNEMTDALQLNDATAATLKRFCPNDKKKEIAKKKEKSKSAANTRCSFGDMYKLMTLIKADDAKKNALKGTIFEHYLDISERKIAVSLLVAMIENFDVDRKAFKIGNSCISFCMKEVQYCLGFDCVGEDVKVSEIEKGPSPLFLNKYFPGLKLTRMDRKKALELVENFPTEIEGWKDDFLRLCICYMFSVFFFTGCNVFMSFWPLDFFGRSMDEFSRYNWGKAIYNYLLVSIEHFTKSYKKKPSPYLKGCLPLLETLAFRRLALKCVKNDVISRAAIITYAESDIRSLEKLSAVLRTMSPKSINKCDGCVPADNVVGESSKQMTVGDSCDTPLHLLHLLLNKVMECKTCGDAITQFLQDLIPAYVDMIDQDLHTSSGKLLEFLRRNFHNHFS
ncbi:PREDICTED: uncharacterized protein LOC109243171 isoform X2 [Nicotiana attenuata]|uniref:uncharacterized protein LOC109243171 isoform X2 n=1 Tax=Nicotiana attenuata TaxID=49451 RepID=UPI0009057746|nr:PREDICTED: uncharacterized protein LOC109243171 isoform X2 [Nicotiana attenuata]